MELKHCPFCGARFMSAHVDNDAELGDYEMDE